MGWRAFKALFCCRKPRGELTLVPNVPSSDSSSFPFPSSHEPDLGNQYVDIGKIFEKKKELRRGESGVTYLLCMDKATGKEYACRSIPRENLLSMQEIGDLRREVRILQHLSGKSNIVEFRGVYEDSNNVYLVTEFCTGGGVLDRIVAKRNYSERDAAMFIRQILNMVHHCHSNGTMHRDLSLENFMLASNHSEAPLKATDFRFSLFLEQGKVYKDIVGSAYYAAPEMLKQNYGKEIDVWSAGIILYIFLNGVPPFCADTKKGIFDAILRGNIDLRSTPWPYVSVAAKDLIRKMLNYDPKKRITASEALEHPWMKEGGEASDEPIAKAVLIRMKRFRAINKIKKLALKVVKENVSVEENYDLRQMLNNIDTDRSGRFEYEELKVAFTKLGFKISESEMRHLIDSVDVDQSGTIDYIECFIANINRHILEKDKHLLKTFKYFDKDNRGCIRRDEFRQTLTEYLMGDEAVVDEAIDAFDNDYDGKIDYEEFICMMRKKLLDNDEKVKP